MQELLFFFRIPLKVFQIAFGCYLCSLGEVCTCEINVNQIYCPSQGSHNLSLIILHPPRVPLPKDSGIVYALHAFSVVLGIRRVFPQPTVALLHLFTVHAKATQRATSCILSSFRGAASEQLTSTLLPFGSSLKCCLRCSVWRRKACRGSPSCKPAAA